jgi:hypothetical protein
LCILSVPCVFFQGRVSKVSPNNASAGQRAQLQMGIRYFAGEPRKFPSPKQQKTANPKPQKTAKLGLG